MIGSRLPRLEDHALLTGRGRFVDDVAITDPLHAAFDATMKDPEFLSDAAKSQADVSPVSAGEIERLLADVYATPKDIVAKAAKAMTN